MKNESWTFEDYQKGDCSLAMVNTIKVIQSPVPEQLPEQPPDDSEWTDDVYASELAAYRRDGDSYRRNNATNLNKLIELGEKNKALRLSASARLADLTATKLKAMDDRAIWLKVIMGVQQNVEPEQFDAILTAWGIDPAQLLEMVESGELTDD